MQYFLIKKNELEGGKERQRLILRGRATNRGGKTETEKVREKEKDR